MWPCKHFVPVGEWQRFRWADEGTEATVAIADGVSGATALLQRLGPTQEAGSMTFDAELDLQGLFTTTAASTNARYSRSTP